MNDFNIDVRNIVITILYHYSKEIKYKSDIIYSDGYKRRVGEAYSRVDTNR